MVLAIIIGCTLLTWLSLLFAGGISRVIGNTGLLVFQRAFGIIVISVGVEVIVRGIMAHAKTFIAGG